MRKDQTDFDPTNLLLFDPLGGFPEKDGNDQCKLPMNSDLTNWMEAPNLGDSALALEWQGHNLSFFPPKLPVLLDLAVPTDDLHGVIMRDDSRITFCPFFVHLRF